MNINFVEERNSEKPQAIIDCLLDCLLDCFVAAIVVVAIFLFLLCFDFRFTCPLSSGSTIEGRW